MKIVYETILQTVFNTLQLIFLQFMSESGHNRAAKWR